MSQVESVTLQRREPQIARCSRFFFAEHDLLDRKDGHLVCSIYSTHQYMDASGGYRLSVGIQTFAVLWESDGIDSRLFNVIEEAIACDVLAPVQLINHSKGMLTLLVDPSYCQISGQFEEFWRCIATNVICDSWELRILCEQDMQPSTEGRMFREYAQSILAVENLGIEDISLDHFLFREEWDQVMEEIASSQRAESEINDDQSAFDPADNDKLNDAPPF
ncbi:hypothetical protein ACF8FB_25895 [Pseudomonas sp. yb_2]|uniref:hypothetical protein n=1 Tax=Pseudomonas sp. yb_2 TaxID=3367218 RepID=UPI00370CE89E